MNFRLKAHRTRRAGFSLVEVAIAALIVGVVMVTALKSVGAYVRGKQAVADRGWAWMLIEEMSAELATLEYEEPDGASGIGPDSGESSGGRSVFDDVDDVHGWSASPPVDRDGNPLTDSADWTRSVSVAYADADDLTATSVSDEGFKRITVTISRNGETVAEGVTIRAAGWPTPPFN